MQADRDRRGGDHAGYREMKPKKDIKKIIAVDAPARTVELYQFELDLGEIGVTTSTEPAYRHLRAVSVGKARDVLDPELAQGHGAVLKIQLDDFVTNDRPRQNRDQAAALLFNQCITAIERAVRLTPEKRLGIAESGR